MTLPQKPIACAIKITELLQQVQQLTGEALYPLDMKRIVQDVSRQYFPEAPITEITGASFRSDIDGMLKKIPGKNEWGIIYNKDRSQGRINFTLAHELGHHLIHRPRVAQTVFECRRQDMMASGEEHGQREVEANEFASYILMPRNDFEGLLKGQKVTLQLIQEIADHFNVSLTAAVLKWLSFTPKRAMLIVGIEGFIDWVWSSEALRKSGVYLQPKKAPIELPSQSLAVQKAPLDDENGITHKPGVWPFKETVQEMTISADAYEMTITLLLFPDKAPNRFAQVDEEPELMDTFEKFQGSTRRAN